MPGHGSLSGDDDRGELALATRAVRKSYGRRLALDGLDLSVPTGVVYGFLGPNGAGKTTTMRLLTGLIHLDGGTIEMLGRPFARGDRQAAVRGRSAHRDAVVLPVPVGPREPARPGGGRSARRRKSRIEEVLELVGLRERAGDKVSRYSLGMKQRLGIAGALLSDPKLLLLDEPANGLDPAGIVAMRETLKHFASTGKTVFVSSHLLAEVQQLADVVGIIAAGKLVREGTMRGPARDARASFACASHPRRSRGPATSWPPDRRQTTWPPRPRSRAGWPSRCRRTGRPSSTGR